MKTVIALVASFFVAFGAAAKVPTGYEVEGPADYVLDENNRVVWVKDCKDPKVWKKYPEASCLFEGGDDENEDQDDDE